jgi:hypothetical protein
LPSLGKRAILPYVLFLVTVAMFVCRTEPNEEVYRGTYIEPSLAPFGQAVSEEKIVQHIKTYLACNFKVNLITHLEVIAHFSSNFKNVNNFHPLFQKLLEIKVKFKLQTCAAY